METGTITIKHNRLTKERVLKDLNRNVKTQQEVVTMGMSRCNIICMRKAGNKDINQSQYIGKTS